MSVRVCHISTVHPANDDRIFNRECATLAGLGYDVHLVIPAEHSCITGGITVHAIWRARNRLLRMCLMPWVALRAGLVTEAAIYHFHDPELIPMGFVLRRVFRKRVVYDVHEAVPKQIMSKEWLPCWARAIVASCYRLMERLLTPGLSLILANENSVTDYASTAYLVRNYPLLTASPTEPTDCGWKESSATPDLLVYVGGVSHDRGAMLYIELAHSLLLRGRQVRLMIIGPCAKVYEDELRARIDSLVLGDAVTLTGRLEHSEAMGYARQAAVGLCLLMPVPNYTTCLATKILEYMMLGTPVLSSDFDVWRPYVEGERVGRMVDPLRLDQVVSVCDEMLADADELRAMGARGRAAVRDRYNWTLELAALCRCYDDLLAARPLVDSL